MGRNLQVIFSSLLSTKLSHIMKTLFRFFVFFSLIASAVAQTEIQELSMLPDGSVALFCSQEPQLSTSELSAEKTKIILRLKNTISTDKAREFAGKGAVDNVFVQNDKGTAVVYIVLKQKSGFTTAIYPYSQCLVVHIFDWKKVTPKENAYYSGLFALESKVNETAHDYFLNSEQLGNGDAAAMLGFLLMKAGKIDESIPHFLHASELKTTIPDVFAALSEIYAHRQDPKRAERFASLYTQKTKKKDFPHILDGFTSSDTFVEPHSLAQNLLSDESPHLITIENPQDSAKTDNKPQQKIDTINQPTPRVQASVLDSTFRQNQTAPFKSLLPTWATWALGGFVLISIFGIFLMAWLYLRWRKNQTQKSSEIRTKSNISIFESEMQEAFQSTPAQKAVASYQQASDLQGFNQDEQNVIGISEETISTTEESKPVKHWMDELDDSIEDRDTNISIANVEIYQERTIPTIDFAPQLASSDIERLAQKFRKGQGELEMAIHLLARQKQEAQARTTLVDAASIPEKSSQVSKMAKELGVSSSELEMKRNLNAWELKSQEKFMKILGETH